MRSIVFVILAALTACAGAPKPRPPATAVETAPSASEVERELRAFLHQFENLDWDPFIAAFVDDACVFHPTARTPQLFCGRDAVRAKWREVFDGIRAGSAGPPYMQLVPENLHIMVLGAESAVAMFELHNAERTGRRSVVFVRREGAWKILHVHASNVPWPDAP